MRLRHGEQAVLPHERRRGRAARCCGSMVVVRRSEVVGSASQYFATPAVTAVVTGGEKSDGRSQISP